MKKLDKINCRILEILQQNSAITNSELACKLGMAPATILERVKKLEKNGFIKKYVALVDMEKAGKGIVVFISVTMSEHSVESIKKFNDTIEHIPEILECYRLAGEKDYVLKVIADDIKSYEKFSTEKLALIPGIARLSTTFVLSTVKRETAIPLNIEK